MCGDANTWAPVDGGCYVFIIKGSWGKRPVDCYVWKDGWCEFDERILPGLTFV
jgi:hypothetical protein